MNSRWIGLPLLYPEEGLLAITKSPQIRMTVFALIRHEEFDIKRLQGRLIEGQRTFDTTDFQALSSCDNDDECRRRPRPSYNFGRALSVLKLFLMMHTGTAATSMS